ncbi:unnamed protein product, partial [Rotaria sp. Silwood1]
MVEKIAGSIEAKLLETQDVRSVYFFLNTEDVFDILSIPCSPLKDIKILVCLVADDNTFIVKPGCRSSTRYLHQLLQQKHEEHLKEITLKSKRHKQTIIHQNNTTITDLSQDPTQTVSTPSVHQHSMETAGYTLFSIDSSSTTQDSKGGKADPGIQWSPLGSIGIQQWTTNRS